VFLLRVRLYLTELGIAIGRTTPLTAGGHRPTWVSLTMQPLISLAVLGVGAYVIHDPSTSQELKHVAAGWIGFVLGYWLS